MGVDLSTEILEKLNALMELIDKRIDNLVLDRNEDFENNFHHSASRCSGEIESLEWVKEKMMELEI